MVLLLYNYIIDLMWNSDMNIRLLVFCSHLLVSLEGYAFIQSIHNHAQQLVRGKIIFRPLFSACQHIEFEIPAGAFKDIDTALCLIKEITVGAGPDESFIRGESLKGWSNVLWLIKTDKGNWHIVVQNSQHP